MLPEDLFVRLGALAPMRLRYDATKLDNFAAWQELVRDRLGVLLRQDLWPKQPVAVEVEEAEHEEKFTRYRVRMEAGPLFSNTAWLLIPRALATPTPALLALHGHGGYMAGKDMVAAPRQTHDMARECAAALNYGYGVQLAELGYITLCPDGFNFGERVLPKDRWSHDHICDAYAHRLSLYGYSSMGITVGTNHLWLDYLCQRPEVDGQRLGCIGLSYGGVQVLFTAVMEEHLRVAVVSGALHSMAPLQAAHGGDGICGAQLVPGLLEWFDLGDLAISLAPRPVLYELMQRDGCFDFRASSTLYAEVARVYAALQVPDHTALDTPDTDHRYSGALVPEFLSRFL